MNVSDNKNNYISLREAAKYCSYSQDYLKLRARQGKFKAVKIGRNWVTTREWLSEYLQQGRVAPLSGATSCSAKRSNQGGATKRSRFIFLFLCLGLLASLWLPQPQVKVMLADILDLIPGRVVEIR